MRTLVVYCHPNPDSFVAAARDRVLAGLEAGGHDMQLVDLYADGFRPELSAAGEVGKRTAFRSVRAACNRRVRTSWTAIYGLDRADEAKRVAWLERVEARFSRF